MKAKLLLFMLLAVISAGFAQVNSVALVGEAAGGWPGDPGNPGPTDLLQMTSTDGENWTLTAVTLTNALPASQGGGVKFRANNDWAINWGAAAFPTGTGVLNGANIPCIGGTYDVTFNSTTGVYNFAGGTPVAVVNLVGTAIEGGAPIAMITTDGENYTGSNVTLIDGNAQFEIDGTGYGDTGFPTGTIFDPAVFIPVTAGTYTSITVNISSGDYSFTAAPVYPSIAIVGNGAGGWPNDPQVDANVLATTDGETYTGSVALTAWDGVPGSGTGEIKFRSNNDWSQPNWGGGSFPSGPDANNLTGNIVVTTSGYYYVVFTRSTGAYTFSIPSVALVGAGTPFGWPTGAAGEIDGGVMTTTDGLTYTLNSITLTDGPGKFRQNNDWGVNWGAAAFPVGTGVLNSPDNIPFTAGTYGVTFNRQTGAYVFGDVLATSAFNASAFKVYPNPTANNWNFTAPANEKINSIQIVDMLGKIVQTVNVNNTGASIDASGLNSGIYFARIATANATQTVKVVRN